MEISKINIAGSNVSPVTEVNAVNPNIQNNPTPQPVSPTPTSSTSFKVNPISPVANPKPKFAFRMPKMPQFGSLGKKGKIALYVLLGLLVVVVLTAISGLLFYGKVKAFRSQVTVLIDAGKSQDINLIKTELDNTKASLKSLHGSYYLISWTGIVPFFGGYTRDIGHGLTAGEHSLEAASVVLSAVEPYADLLGFKNGGEVAVDGAQTAQERIDFVVASIPELVPKIDQISASIGSARTELNKIKPERYPETISGKEVRSKIKKGLDLFDEAATLISQSKPILEATPYLLGLDAKRTYLILFQNDKELRPTGGFLTAYAIMDVDKAKFEPTSSSDIYNLDAKYKPTIPAPQPIIDYIKGPYQLSKNLRLRDMNWSPDFKESMDMFLTEAESVGIEDVDGIIAVDTQLLVNLLDAMGPIGVSGFGNFSTEIIPECNCPQVIYELESFADVEGPVVWDPAGTGKIIYAPANYDNRKRIIGPLMNSIMANALGQPKEKLPALFEAAFKSILEKHVLLYLKDETAQAASESFNIAGRIKSVEGDKDYLHINDSNLGGRKSNLYATSDVEQDVEIARDGTVTKTLTITYKNPEKHDGWLNSVLPNWVRIYVPEGSELLTFEGVADKVDPYSELGKTVFAGGFELRPQGVSKVIVSYKLPFKVDDTYRVLIQKQPGVAAPLYVTRVGKFEEELLLNVDRDLKFNL